MANHHKKNDLSTYKFQQTVSIPLERCVTLLESKNRLKQYINIDNSGFEAQTELTRLDDTRVEFRLRVGGRLRMYSSSWIQVEAKGLAQSMDESHTIVAYNKNIAWSSVLLLYGIPILLILIYALSNSTILLMLVVLGVNGIYEGTIARDHLKLLTAYINNLG